MTEQELIKFRDEVIEEIKQQMHPENGPFNFGLASADAALRRVVTKWLEIIEEEDKHKIF